MADIGHYYEADAAVMGYMHFPHNFPVIKFRHAENLALDYSDFMDERLR